MKAQVRLFARARDLVGSDLVEIELPSTATVGELRCALNRQFPALLPVSSTLLFAVGTDYAVDSHPVTSGMEIACFPPVSGG